MRGVFLISVCDDCLMFLANGQSATDDDDHEGALRDMEIAAGVSRLTKDGGNVVAGNEELGFSRHACECCRSGLGGNRHEASVIYGRKAVR